MRIFLIYYNGAMRALQLRKDWEYTKKPKATEIESTDKEKKFLTN